MAQVIKDDIESALNDKQKAFCVEYLKELNATKAYISVYESDYNTARVNSSRLLAKANVKKYINDLMDIYKQNMDITVAEIVKGIKTIAQDEEATHNNKLKAFELLAKYKQMFVDKTEVTVNKGDSLEDMSMEDINKAINNLSK